MAIIMDLLYYIIYIKKLNKSEKQKLSLSNELIDIIVKTAFNKECINDNIYE